MLRQGNVVKTGDSDIASHNQTSFLGRADGAQGHEVIAGNHGRGMSGQVQQFVHRLEPALLGQVTDDVILICQGFTHFASGPL